MRPSGYPLLCFALKIFYAEIPESWLQRERTLEQQPAKTICAIRASRSCKQLERCVYEDRQHGKTQNGNLDLSTSSLLLLWSLLSFAIRNFGIQVLYLSSFSLRRGERATQKFKVFSSRPHPLPKPLYLQSCDFSLFPPRTTPVMQTLAVIYTSTCCCHNHLAARHQDMLFLLKVFFSDKSLPGWGWLSGLGDEVFLP